MDTLTQAIIGGIFSLIGVWFKHRLENRSQRPSNQRGAAAKPIIPPKEIIRKGIKRFFWGVLLILIMTFIMHDNPTDSDKFVPSVIGLLGFFTFFSGIWLFLKGIFKYIFS
ncbi:MAG: hypothetical protein KA215_08280 [Flavobacterium sp.]|nr:hypothetical protein [Flavobacterium sp.]